MPYEIPNAVNGQDITPTDHMKIALVGEPKIGKSWLAATAPEPWFFDFDDRLNSLHGKPISGKTYFDYKQTNPTAWLTFEQDLSMFEYHNSQKKPIPKTFVLDSGQNMCQACENYIHMVNPSMRKELKVGASVFYASNSWDTYNLEHPMLQDAISRLYQLGNVILTLHEAPEEAPESTAKNPIFTGRLTVYPVRCRKLLPIFNDQWRLISDNGIRRVITDISDYKFTASTTLLLDSKEEPDIQKMIAKHQSRLGQKK